MFDSRSLDVVDAQLAQALRRERQRQEQYLELIASENYVSPRVLAAQGSVLTNKYADGYPGHRHYRGCELADVAETLAIERAGKLFGADYVNVQPYSGSQANLAAYLAMLEPGDKVLGMRPAHGGHRTHGAFENLSGRLYDVVAYDVDSASGEIDYDQVASARARASSEARHRGLLGVLAGRRLESIPRDRGRCRRLAARRYRARRRPDCGGALSEPDRARGRRDDDHAQDAARPARGHDPRSREFAAYGACRPRRVPRNAGRSPDARDRREGRCVRRSARARVRNLSASGARERAADGRNA